MDERNRHKLSHGQTQQSLFHTTWQTAGTAAHQTRGFLSNSQWPASWIAQLNAQLSSAQPPSIWWSFKVLANLNQQSSYSPQFMKSIHVHGSFNERYKTKPVLTWWSGSLLRYLFLHLVCCLQVVNKSENVIYKNQTLSFKWKYSKLMFMGTTSAINIFYSYF